jgi:apolipoprotein N-acyltransferase
MQRMTTEDAAPAGAAGLAGAVYAPAWRLVIAALRVQSRAGLLLVMGLVVFGSGLDLTPLVLFRVVTVLAALPGLAAWLLERAFAARLAIDATELVVHARGRRLEIPRDAVAAAVPWRVPLPRPGVTLRLRSGRRLAVALDDPGALLARLGIDEDRHHPSSIGQPHARAAVRRAGTTCSYGSRCSRSCPAALSSVRTSGLPTAAPSGSTTCSDSAPISRRSPSTGRR